MIDNEQQNTQKIETSGEPITVENTTINSDNDEHLLYYKHKTDSNSKEIERLKTELSNERFNNLTIFGIFASLVTFFSIEIQVFKNIDNFWLIIGLTSFLVSSMLLFVFSVHSIARDRLSWKSFFSNPTFWIFLLFLGFSFTIFLLNSEGINIDLQIKSQDNIELIE